MKLEEYIKMAKKELEDWEKEWKEENQKNSNNWPLEMSEEDWGDQELEHRFGMLP